MEALLQQSKGSKGNFLPEHRFKRKAYTFYCHREGAAVNSSLAVLEGELPNTDQEIHNYKMAHKVLTYLRDQPPHYMNPEFMPLWIRKNDEEVEIDSVEDLLQFISEKKLFSKLRLKKKEFSSGIEVVKGKKSKASNSGKKKSKELADNKRIGVIEMTLKGEENYIFEINFPTLYQICLECFIHAGKTEHFYKILESLARRRTFLREIFSHPQAHYGAEYFGKIKREYFYPRDSPKEKAENEARELGKTKDEIMEILASILEEPYTLDNLASFPIGASSKVQVLLTQWKEALVKGEKKEEHLRNEIIQLLSPSTEPASNKTGRRKPKKIGPTPILVHLAEFYKGDIRKPRKKNQFLEFAAQYLMDFCCSSKWEFAYEDYQSIAPSESATSETTRIKKIIRYSHKVPEGYRLKIMKDHVLFRVPKQEAENGRELRSDEYFYFMLGQKAMVYILYWLLVDKKHKKKNSGKLLYCFIDALRRDLNKLEEQGENAIPNLELYELGGEREGVKFSTTLPKFKLGSASKPDYSKSKIKDKVEREILRWQAVVAKKGKLFRFQLNTEVLRAYKLFDFGATEGGKYLRKNEYKLMSVVHYSVNENEKPNHLLNTITVNGTLLKDRIPKRVHEIILRSHSLEDLLEKVLYDRIENLKVARDQLIGSKRDISTIGKACYFVKRLIQRTSQEERERGQQNSYPFLPLYIHPNLVLKHFDNDEYLEGKYHPNIGSQKKYRNLYTIIRGIEEYAGRVSGGYYQDVYKLLIQSGSDSGIGPAQKNRMYWYNKYRLRTHSEDILLGEIALKYLKQVEPELVGEYRSKGGKHGDLQKLFKTQVIRTIVEQNIKGSKGEKIYLSFRLHQAGSHFYRVEQKNFSLLAQHYLRRVQNEIAYYQEKNPGIADKYKAMPDGSIEKPIELGHLIQERKIIGNTNMEIAAYLLNVEREWINQIAGDGDGQEKQAKLIAEWKNVHKNKDVENRMKYFAFNDVLGKHKSLESVGERITKLRNEVFHNDIPETPYIPYLGEKDSESELFEVLRIEGRVGKDKSQEFTPFVESEK